MQNLTSDSCSATSISYKGDEISRLSRPVFEFPIWGYLGVWGIWGDLGTCGAKSDVRSFSATPISYKGDEISRLTRLIIKIPNVGYFGVLGVFRYFGYLGVWGYLATSCAKSEARILLDDPDFLYIIGDEITRLSRSVIEFPILGYLGGLGDFRGLRYFGCKI